MPVEEHSPSTEAWAAVAAASSAWAGPAKARAMLRASLRIFRERPVAAGLLLAAFIAQSFLSFVVAEKFHFFGEGHPLHAIAPLLEPAEWFSYFLLAFLAVATAHVFLGAYTPGLGSPSAVTGPLRLAYWRGFLVALTSQIINVITIMPLNLSVSLATDPTAMLFLFPVLLVTMVVGFLLLYKLAFAAYMALLEDHGMLAAFKHSWQRTAGLFWTMFRYDLIFMALSCVFFIPWLFSVLPDLVKEPGNETSAWWGGWFGGVFALWSTLGMLWLYLEQRCGRIRGPFYAPPAGPEAA